MKKLLFFVIFQVTAVFVYAQGYKNPVIPGFYPDPSICRVGSDYYLVNSSFEYFPGVPVWHSKDMVHWQQIGNILNRESQLPLKNCKPSNGIYAPTIRYNKGTFYMVVTLVNGDKHYGNFYVTAQNPAGPWSDPIGVDQNGIDPSLFFDDDGKVYFISNRGHNSNDPRAIYQSQIDVKTGKRLTEIKELWKGSGGSYVEAPHMYKKDGFYYLQTAEGGTSYGHSVAISRSKSIWGPYQSCPNNPILTNRMAYSNIQGTGHADMVQATDGSWWLVHLGFRPAVDGVHFIGRETCLTPVEWPEGQWPVVNGNGQTDEVIKKTPPDFDVNGPLPNNLYANNFDNGTLGFDWIYLRNPDSTNYSLFKHPGFLSLKGSAFNLFDLESPTFVGRRQSHFNLKLSTNLIFNPQNENEEAGLTLLMTNVFHYDVFVKKLGGQRVVVVRYALDSLKQVLTQMPLEDGPVELKVIGNKQLYHIYYQQNGKLTQLAILNTRFLGTEVTGGYNGVIMGLYATGNGKKATSTADFDWFKYEPIAPF